MFTLWNELRNAGFSELARTFASIDQLQRTMDPHVQSPVDAEPRGLHSPRMHAHEGESAVTVRVEVPGFRREDLEVTVTGDVLSIRGQRQAHLPEGYTVHHRERSALGFNRSFRLARLVDAARIEAAVKDGVLTLTLPRASQAQPRRIQVKTHS